VSPEDWEKTLEFGAKVVSFLHQAVEWENLLFFSYPYFWGSQGLAQEKLLFEHPDPLHRDFLRAGYVRVVLPVRPGYEIELAEFLDRGEWHREAVSPYMPIAEEIANFARTNYAGIPPANPEKHARPLLYPEQRRTWAVMEEAVKQIEAYKLATKEYPTKLTSLPGAPFKDAWGHELTYRNPGRGNDYDLVSYGSDGKEGGEGLDADISAAAAASLIATWFDYTPTSGIDIELTEKPAGSS
jgi:Type II secretion system (T2SS), protein G